MKKFKLFILGILLSSTAFAERYPIEMEYGFLDGCIANNKKMVDYCVCALKEIEKDYTAQEFIRFYEKNPKGFKKKIIKEILPRCIDKLNLD